MTKKVHGKKDWQTLSSDVVHENPWFHIVHDTFVTPKKTIGNYYVIHSNGGSNRSVLVVPVQDDTIFFVRQYRYVVSRWQIEVPGGGVRKGQSSLQAARQELEEELGYKTKKIVKIGAYRPYSGPLPETCSVYLATQLVKTQQKLEDTEIGATVVPITISSAYDMINDGRINDGQTIAALAIARQHIC